MDIEFLRHFLESFLISEDIIFSFLNDKKLIEFESNFYLVKKNFSAFGLFSDFLVFINLNQILPSKYLLNFIYNNSNNLIELKSEKQALNFTYGKSLSFSSIINKYQLKFNINENYLVIYDNRVLGYFKYEPSNKKFPLRNMMNIGEYLHEN